MIEGIIAEAAEFIQEEFKFSVKKSALHYYSSSQWFDFCRENNFDKNCDGLYLPEDYSAHASSESDVFISNAFHEYFGHGLFCEHSEIGIALHEAELKGKGNKHLYGPVDMNKQLFGLTTRNIGNYEGFALWLEALLCQETGNSDIWGKKMSLLPHDYVMLFEAFKDAEQKLTRFGFLSQLGFPKHYSNETLLNTLKKFYANNFKEIEFIISYGSKKPESDIDLFVVTSGESLNVYNGWLDIYQMNKQEFEGKIRMMDISVLDPLFSGEQIYGAQNNLQKIKREIEDAPITESAIIHNNQQAEIQRGYLLALEDQRDLNICKSYIASYSRMAEELLKGRKGFTKGGLGKKAGLCQ